MFLDADTTLAPARSWPAAAPTTRRPAATGPARGAIHEDVELARSVRRARLGVHCRVGGDAVSFRVYPRGFAQSVESSSKTVARGARAATRPLFLALIVLWISAIASVALSAVGLLGGEASAEAMAVVGTAYAAVAMQLRWQLRRVDRFRWWAWALGPAPLVLFIALFIRSLVLVVLRRAVKGRRVAPAFPGERSRL
ncbi:MAG: hypothetical protein ACHQNA_02440 [Acidimicrobiales bacterium]